MIDRSFPISVHWLLAPDGGTATDPSGSEWRVAERRLTPAAPQVRPPDNRPLADEPAGLVQVPARSTWSRPFR